MSRTFHRAGVGGAMLFATVLMVVLTLGSSGGDAAAFEPATRTWTGAGANSNWNNAANWSDAVPKPGDILVFPEGALRKANMNNFAPGTSFTQIRVEGTGYSLLGNRVVITDRVEHAPGPGDANNLAVVIDGPAELYVNSGTLNVLEANLYTGTTFVNGGTLHAGSSSAFALSQLIDLFSGTLTLAPGVNMFNDIIIGGPANPVVMALGSSQWQGDFVMLGDGEVDVEAGATFTISGTVGGSLPLVKTGLGRLTMSGINTLFFGTIEVREGVLRATRAEAFGGAIEGTKVSDGATLELETMGLPGEQLEIRGAGFEGMGALRHLSGISNIGNVFVADDAKIQVDNGTLRLTNGLDGAGESTILDQAGAGRLELESNGNFDGILRVNDGELAVRGTLLCEVRIDGGIVTGDGEVADLTVTVGTVKPGVDGVGTLSVEGDFYISNNAAAEFRLQDSPKRGSIRVAGAVEIDDAGLTLTIDGPIPLGSTFALIRNEGGGAIVGKFSAVPQGTPIFVFGEEFAVSYAGGVGDDDFVLTRSGEPYNTSASYFPPPATVAKDSEFEVTFLLFNLGSTDVAGPYAEIPILQGLVFAGFDALEGWNCVAPGIGTTGGGLVCDRATWAPTGPTAGVELRVRYRATGAVGSVATVKVVLGHSGTEVDTQDNSKEATITIGPADPRPFKLRLPFLAKDGTN